MRQILDAEDKRRSNAAGTLLSEVDWIDSRQSSNKSSRKTERQSGEGAGANLKDARSTVKDIVREGGSGATAAGERPLQVLKNNPNGSSVESREGKVTQLVPSQGKPINFSRSEDGSLSKISIGNGEKVVEKGEDGKWYLKEKSQDGKERSTELKEQPKVKESGSFRIELKEGGAQEFKTDGSRVHTRADGNLVQIDYADGGKRTVSWKGEGKDAKENVIRTFRADGSKSEQLQAHDNGKYLKFTWEKDAKDSQYKYGGELDAVKSYKTGDLYTRGSNASRGDYESTDKSKTQYDEKDRLTKLTTANGETREFGYFEKGNEVKWAKLPNGSQLTRDSKDADFSYITRDSAGREQRSPSNLTLKVDNGIYSWQKTDGSDPHKHIVLPSGKELLETAGGGRAITDSSGKIQKYVYAPTGREMAVDAKGEPTKIIERNGQSWALTDRSKNVWTSNTGESKELTVKDGDFSYTDEKKVAHTFKRDGTEERKLTDGTVITLSGDKTTTAAGSDGKKITYKYAADGLQKVTDTLGSTWERNSGSADEWTRTKDGKAESLKGKMKVNEDGSYAFEGSKEGKDFQFVRNTDGTTSESIDNLTKITKRDGSSTKVEYTGDGERQSISSIASFDQAGKELFSYKREQGDTPLTSKWKSDKRGEFEGDINVSDKGILSFRKLNQDKSISTLDDSGKVKEIQLPGGGVRKFEYDGKNNLSVEMEYHSKDDKNPLLWKRDGATDIWKSNNGAIWSGQNRIDSAAGVKWERNAEKEDQWTVTRNGRAETLSGALKLNNDGSYKFEGKGDDSKTVLEYKQDGALIDKRGDQTRVFHADGTETRVNYQTEGSQKIATQVAKYDKDGKEIYNYERVAGGDPLKSSWKSMTKGEFQGDIKINEKGDLIFSKLNADKTVSGTDDQGRLREQSYTDKTVRTFEYDKDGNLNQETRFETRDDKNPTVWARQASTNFWVSNKGALAEGKWQVKDGKFSIQNESGLSTMGADGKYRVDEKQKLDLASDLNSQRAGLKEVIAGKVKDSAETKRFESEMAAFEKRAKETGLSDKEVANTYRELSRLLVTPGDQPVTQSDKTRLAMHAITHFADPTSTDQGWHNTCNVTTVESILASTQPAAMARLLADVGTTGKFRTKDGTEIKLDPKSLQPDKEADSRYPVDWNRSYASQVFQLTAANIHWQRQTNLPDGSYAGKGNIQYTQVTGPKAYPGDTRERIVNLTNGSIQMQTDTAGGTRPNDSPHLSPNPLPDIVQQITGKTPDTLVIANSAYPGVGGKGISTVSSLDGFHQKLSELVKSKERRNDGSEVSKLPIILCVHTGKKPFSGSEDEGGSGGSKGSWHVVTVTGYDEKTGMVQLDNQWGRKWDHLGRADGKSLVHVRDLYPATYK
jgi:YD repeat-containing protein